MSAKSPPARAGPRHHAYTFVEELADGSHLRDLFTAPSDTEAIARAQDVIEDDQMVVAELLDRACVLGDRVGIGADLELREDRADLHQGFVMLTGTPMPLTRTSAPPASGRA